MAFANFNPRAATSVDFANPERAPLLLIAGSDDHTVSASVDHSAAKLYNKHGANGSTDYKEFGCRSLSSSAWKGGKKWRIMSSAGPLSTPPIRRLVGTRLGAVDLLRAAFAEAPVNSFVSRPRRYVDAEVHGALRGVEALWAIRDLHTSRPRAGLDCRRLTTAFGHSLDWLEPEGPKHVSLRGERVVGGQVADASTRFLEA
jgi:hypothetical protein